MHRVDATGSGVGSGTLPSIRVLPARRRAAAGAAPELVGPDRDIDLLALLDRGDIQAALHGLMQRHGRAVFRYCRLALGDPALAEDIHQQVFIEAFRDLPGFGRRSTLRTWLFGIARHRVLDAAKRRRRSRADLDADAGVGLPDPQPPAGDRLDDAQLRAALTSRLTELEAPVRTAVLLRYQQGLTYEEMAEICGEKPGTLQARVTRAVRKLRDLLADPRTPRRRDRMEKHGLAPPPGAR